MSQKEMKSKREIKKKLIEGYQVKLFFSKKDLKKKIKKETFGLCSKKVYDLEMIFLIVI
jgi:hypothetical protein